jgi:hypothetical protein
MEDMQSIAMVVEPMKDESWARWEYAKTMVKPADLTYNPRQDSARLDVLLGGLAYEAKSNS